jgi:hypothetical protein
MREMGPSVKAEAVGSLSLLPNLDLHHSNSCFVTQMVICQSQY